MTNGSSQGIFVIVALVIFGIFVFISYLLFRDSLKPSLAKIYCDAFTITSKNTGFGKLGNCGLDSEGSEDKIQRTYYKIREATPEKGWSEVWVLVKKLDNGHVEIIDSGNKDKFSEGDLGVNLIGDISFPDAVGDGLIIENIGKSAFKNAKFDNVMKLPKDLIILDDYSLQQSHFSGEAQFPENLEIIGIEALRDSRFTGNLPKMPNMKEIRDNAFQDSIFEGNLPNLPNVNFVGKDAFKNSIFTGTFNGIGSNVDSGDSGGAYGGYGGAYGGYGGSGSSHGYGSGSGVVIADGAFANSKFTGKPNIPSNVSIIGDNAFRNSNFTQLDLKNNTELVAIGDNAFENSNLTGVLYLPDSVKYIGNKAFYSCKFINNDWVLPKKLEYIGDYAFYNSSMQGSLTMKENLKHIGNYAFYKSYSDVKVTDNVGRTYGETRAYVNKGYILNLTDSLEYIGDSAFENAVFTGNFVIPTNTKYIGNKAFANSFREYTVDIKNFRSVVALNSSRYYYCINYYSSQPEFKFNENIEYIGANAFEKAHFKDISTIVPKKLHTIGTDAFKLSFGTESKNEFQDDGYILRIYHSKKNTPYNTQTIKVGKALTSHNLENIEVVE